MGVKLTFALAALLAALALVPALAPAQQVNGAVITRDGTTLVISDAGDVVQNLRIDMVTEGVEQRIRVREIGEEGLAAAVDADCDFPEIRTAVCDIAAAIEVKAAGAADSINVIALGEGAITIPVHIDGGSGADELRGGAADDVIDGGPGADQLFGRAGDDELDGGSGNDALDAGMGDDELTGGAGADDLIGAAGEDVARYDEGGRLAGVTVTVGTGEADDGSLEDRASLVDPFARRDDVTGTIEGVVGTPHDDELTGTPTAQGTLLSGGAGDDHLTGGPGNESISGGDGNDLLEGGPGDDRFPADDGGDEIHGGTGFDTVSYTDRGQIPGDGPVEVTLGNGLADDGGVPDGQPGARDNLQADVEAVLGSVLGDRLVGSDGADLLFGDEGDDEIVGGLGADRLLGGIGEDVIRSADGLIDAEIDCGDGTDIIEADALDPVGPDCEQPLELPVALFPDTRITRGPAKRVGTAKKRATVRFRFRSPGAAARFQCKLDRRPFRRCKSPKRLRVKPGRHVFRVRAVDAGGNADPTPAKRRFRVVKR